MQIFEVIELTEYPFMETTELINGVLVSDIINETSDGRVFLLVDHDTKRIWAYNSPKSSLKIQIYGGILAGMLRQQLRLFYRVYPLNMYSQTDIVFKEVMDKQLGPGRANSIEEKDFSKPTPDKYILDTTIQNPNLKKAIDYINQIPQPKNLVRRFMILGGQIFTDEELTESFLKGEINVIKPIKLGRLNNGFTLFKDHDYSTRLIIKDRKIQGLELFINKDDKSTPMKLEIPIILEEKFSKSHSLEDLIKAFKIPENLSEDRKEENIVKDDSINQS
ncbi:MAG: hypothetical protein ACFFA0_13980 [Promethearchaeota archaeon]